MADDSVQTLAEVPVQVTLLGDALEHAEIGAVVWNEDRRYVAVNDRAAALVGCTRAELLAARVGDHVGAAAGASVQQVLQRLPAAGTMRMPRRDGTEVEVQWLAVPTQAAGMRQFLGLFWPVDH